jgi:cell division protein FtsW
MRKTESALVVIVLALLLLGIVMLFSTSSVRALASFHDSHYFLKRQLLWLLMALCAGMALTCFDYHYWQKLAVPVAVSSILLLLLVKGIGAEINGSRRWIRLGFLSFQPSEFAKLALIIIMSSWMAGTGPRARTWMQGLCFPLIWIGLFAGPVILEPDYGTTFLLAVVGMAIMFAGGSRIGHLLIAGTTGACGFALMIMHNRLRMERFFAFLWPEKYPDKAYHLIQSKVAFIAGGPFGVGLSNSMQKQFYLPEAHTDFILAIIGEELGFVATFLVVLAFIGILICGLYISFRAPDPFGRLLGFGITMMTCVQAAFNVGVVTGCLPTKGLPLPFISYGGSSLLVSVAMIGVLLNVARHCREEHIDEHTTSIKDRAHHF